MVASPPSPAKVSATRRHRPTSLLVLLLTLTAWLLCLPVAAHALECSTFDQNTLFDGTDLQIDLSDTHLAGYSYTQNSAKNVKVYEGRYLVDGLVKLWNDKPCECDRPDSVSFRIPIARYSTPTTAQGQAMLDGFSCALDITNVGSYRGRKLKARLEVSNLCTMPLDGTYPAEQHQMLDFDTRGVTGDGDAAGYVVSLSVNDLLNREFTWQYYYTADYVVRFFYADDGTAVKLEDDDYLLLSASSLDPGEFVACPGADKLMLPKGANAVRRMSVTELTKLTDPIVEDWGGVKTQVNPAHYSPKACRADSDAQPVVVGDVGVGWYEWNSNSAVFAMCKGKEATARFTLGNTKGAGYGLSFTPITSYVPVAPTKKVDTPVAYPGQTVNFDVAQRIAREGVDAAKGYRYSTLRFDDEFPAGLLPKRLRVFDGAGADITDKGTAKIEGHRVSFVFSDDYLANMKMDGSELHFSIDAVVDGTVATRMDNTATTTFNGGKALSTNTVSVDPIMPTQSKQLDEGTTAWNKGTVAYTVHVVNDGSGTAGSYELRDTWSDNLSRPRVLGCSDDEVSATITGDGVLSVAPLKAGASVDVSVEFDVADTTKGVVNVVKPNQDGTLKLDKRLFADKELSRELTGRAAVKRDQELWYVVSLSAHGGSTSQGTQVSDVVSSDLELLGCETADGVVACEPLDKGQITWSVPPLDEGQTATCIVHARVRKDGDATTVTNTASGAGQSVVVTNPIEHEHDPLTTPETPETPTTPETPETPQTPETPATPETPETPATPETPQTPATPAAPTTPTSPESPTTPSTPQASTTPEPETKTTTTTRLAKTGEGILAALLLGGGCGLGAAAFVHLKPSSKRGSGPRSRRHR